MTIPSQSAVTPEGVRDGVPAALAALVEHRANAVLAYCEAVCSPATVERAAAEAFARFRAAVAAAEDPRSLNPGALLLSATRHAAASMTIAPTPPPDGGLRRKLGAGRGLGASETCALIPGLLAARAEGALSPADEERLARHLERHSACRALADAVERAEGDYASPPSRIVPIGALTEIMLALTAAAPITAAPEMELDFAEVVLPATEPAPDPQTAPEPEPPLAPPVQPAPPPEPPPVQSAPQPYQPFEPPTAAALEPDPTTTVFQAVVVDEVDEHPGETDPTVVLPPAAIAPRSAAGGVAHPRPPHRHLHLPGTTGDHGVVYHYVVPGLVVAAALVAAMGVAGVFASDDRQPAAASPITTSAPVAPPAGAPPVTPEPSVDAEERSALAAERRTRRERAAAVTRRRARTAAESPTPTTQTKTTPPAAVSPGPKRGPTPVPTPRRAPPQTSTAEKESPAKSSSALPDTGSATTPSADPGVFEGTPPPAP
jgi:hypothetical protein